MPRTAQPRYDVSRNQWYLNYRRKKHFLCSGKGNYVQAMRRASEIMGQPAVTGRPETVGELIAAWIGTTGPSGWSRGMLESWKNAAWSTPLCELDRDHLVRFHQHLKIAPSGHERRPQVNGPRTIRGKVSEAARVLRWACRRGFIGVMPDVPTLEKPPRHPRDYDQTQLQEIFGSLPKSPDPILRFILETGCRPSEACRLRWEDVDLSVGLCVIDRHKIVKRTGEPRTIALSPAAREIIEKCPHREGFVFLNRLKQPFKPGGLRTTLRRCTQKKYSRVYSLRHTRAQSILDNGGSLEDVAAILGNSANTATIYAKIRAERARRVASTLPSPLQPKPAAHSTPQNAAARSRTPRATKRKTDRSATARRGSTAEPLSCRP